MDQGDLCRAHGLNSFHFQAQMKSGNQAYVLGEQKRS
jgi:hypothetical protein